MQEPYIDIGPSIIIDGETLGIRGTATLCELSALCVDFNDLSQWDFQDLRNRTVTMKFDIAEQMKIHNRTTDEDTLEWWKTQPPQVQQIAMPSPMDVSIMQLGDFLEDYVKSFGYNFADIFLFSRGFMDWSIIQDIYRTVLKKEEPFSFWLTRDMRTAQHFIANNKRGKLPLPPELTPSDVTVHSSVDDVVLDAMRMNWVLRELAE